MIKSFVPLTTLALLTLAAAGCESTGSIAARTQEKSAVYATLQPWEKKYIAKGTVAVGFTPDMVYMALGRPTKIATRNFPEGPAELWTYTRAYPNADAIRGFKHASLSLDSAFQSKAAAELTSVPIATNSKDVPGGKTLAVPEPSGNDSIHKTGGPQGGSMEPPDLASLTIQVLFENGQVARLSAVPNSY